MTQTKNINNFKTVATAQQYLIEQLVKLFKNI